MKRAFVCIFNRMRVKGTVLLTCFCVASLFIISQFTTPSTEWRNSVTFSGSKLMSTIMMSRADSTFDISTDSPQQSGKRSIILLAYWDNYVADPLTMPKQISCMDKYFCSLKTTRQLYPDHRSDIAVFHERGLQKTPPLKPKGQLWVFRTGEPQKSLSIDNMENWNGYFNYSIDHVENSTVRTYVEKYQKIDNVTNRDFFTERVGASGSTSLEPTALWFVSNCATDGPFKVGSARAEYAFELSQFINISVHSKKNSQCRQNQLLKHLIKDNILEPQFSDFTFYLSFENLLCKNYITEKLWKILTGDDLIIPIVMGGLSSQEYESIAPPNSYIDVRNFTSPKHLAEHLKFVTSNAEAFNYYHQWRNNYSFDFENGEPPMDSFCRYCMWAWEKPSSVFSNMGDHFNKSQCIDLSEPQQHCPYYKLDCTVREFRERKTSFLSWLRWW